MCLMELNRVPIGLLIFIALVFLVLVAIQLHWGPSAEDRAATDEAGPRLSRIQISKDGRLEDVETEPAEPGPAADELVQTRIGLLSSGTANERRTAAIELAYMTNDATERGKLLALSPNVRARLRQALLAALADPDAAVARSGSEALIGWWRLSDSPTVTQYFQEGLAACDSGQWDVALRTFGNIEALNGAAPPDLYRMKAEAYLAQGLPDQAVVECQRALKAEPKHFMAFCVEAKALAQTGQTLKALEALDEALAIYGSFPEAQRLRAELYQAA
jgi:tetratricopeptide (TPR) repeat protein